MPHFIKIDGQFNPVVPLVKAWYGFKFVIDTDIFIFDGDFILAVGETRLLDVYIEGEDPQGAEFESSNPDAVTVDGNGLTEGVGEGQALITATTVEEPKRSHSIMVTAGNYEFAEPSDVWTFETE